MNSELEFNNGWKRKKQNPWDILYGNTTEELEEKNRLTNFSSNNLTQADILYATNDELNNKIAMNNKKFNDFNMLGENVNKIFNNTKNKLNNPQYNKNNEINNLNNTSNNMMNEPSKQIIHEENMTKFVSPVIGKITSEFGYRKQPTGGASTNHSGIDLQVPIGTPVKAITSGTVIKCGKATGYGNAIYIDHGLINGKRIISEYGHLNNINVKVGDKIKIGQTIAKSGNTGITTGPHLHLTIKENGIAVNPRKYINLK